MTSDIKSVEFVGDYLKDLFEKRKDYHFEESMKENMFKEKETALSVFIHSVIICY